MTTPNNPSQVTSQNEPKSTNSNNNSLIVALLVIVFVVVAILIGVVLFIVFVFVPRPNTPDLYQTCLNSPNTQGCVDCQNNGENGIICNRCEYLNEIIMKNEPFSGVDEEYYKGYCSDSVSDISPDNQVQVTDTAQSKIILFGEEWSAFNYSLPYGGTISGIAPLSHTTSTESSTASTLGSSIDLSFSNYEDSKTTSINISLVVSEGVYYFYDDTVELVDSSRNLYRMRSTVPNWFEYTDSYETSDCENMVTIPQTITSDTCGTGLMFEHSILSYCKYEGDEIKAKAICDEFFKNLTIK